MSTKNLNGNKDIIPLDSRKETKHDKADIMSLDTRIKSEYDNEEINALRMIEDNNNDIYISIPCHSRAQTLNIPPLSPSDTDISSLSFPCLTRESRATTAFMPQAFRFAESGRMSHSITFGQQHFLSVPLETETTHPVTLGRSETKTRESRNMDTNLFHQQSKLL